MFTHLRIGGALVNLCAAVWCEEHVDVFLAVTLLSFTLLLKDPDGFTERLNSSPLALQFLTQTENK